MRKIFWVILGVLLMSVDDGPPAGSGRPQNIVLLIGDGMGLAQVTAAMYDSKSEFILEKFPSTGLQFCHSADDVISESAANATAMAIGKKTLNHHLGVDEHGAPSKTLLQEAVERGLATGIIVTSSLVHATPAAFYSHQQSRTSYEEIAEDFANANIDFAVGGGKRYFDRRGKDRRNLIQELRKKQYEVLDYFHDELYSIVPNPRNRFLFFTADNQPISASQGRDYLLRATRLGLNHLQLRSKKGFFLMIEGSQIDWANHSNQGALLLSEMGDFITAVQQVVHYAKQKGNTLVIVTGDHETGGLAMNPGSTFKRLELKYTTNGHTATMVPVFAFGPGSELFNGVYDNTEIYRKIRVAYGWNGEEN